MITRMSPRGYEPVSDKSGAEPQVLGCRSQVRSDAKKHVCIVSDASPHPVTGSVPHEQIEDGELVGSRIANMAADLRDRCTLEPSERYCNKSALRNRRSMWESHIKAKVASDLWKHIMWLELLPH